MTQPCEAMIYAGNKMSPNVITVSRCVRDFFAVIPLLLLVACAAPRTLQPGMTQAELNRERQTQTELAGAGQGGITREQLKNVKQQPIHYQRLKRVGVPVRNAALAFCKDMGIKNCNYDLVLTKDGPVNAYADGKRIVFSPAMVEAADEDEELAFVMAHEYAHNIMGHVAAQQQNIGLGAVAGTLLDGLLKSQGVNTGNQLGKLGANMAKMRYSQGFEKEADYVGLYVLARTKYGLREAARFWREEAARNPDMIQHASSHPSYPERFVMMNKTIDEINAKRRAGQKLIPAVKKK